MKLNNNALTVLKTRYLKKKSANTIETPEDMFRRVAKTVAQAEFKYGYTQTEVTECEEIYYKVISDLDFMPNSPTLMNAGRDLGQLFACFVLPVKDSMEEIFEAIKSTALIQKSGGGTGFDFSELRPSGDSVRSTQGTSSGPISFMKVFNAATDVIKQGGCFIGSTLVATAKGPVPIKDLKAGTLVYAWDNKMVLVPCTDSWKTKSNTEVWKLTTDKGLVIYATPDHPFLVRYSGLYCKLQDLQPDMALVSFSTEIGEDDARNHRVVSVEFSHHEDVYNVEVPGPHNYVVCDKSMKGVVVSNTRRGASMSILRVDHPDILKFITCKEKEGDFNNFNISVGITKEFMEAATNRKPYTLVNPRDELPVGELDAYEVLELIAKMAHKNGEPGIVFIDRINEYNTTPHLGEIRATNPCWTGDTKVWTVNGPVSFKELADKGEDVTVLSQDSNGKLISKLMRNPRLTRKNTELVKIILNDGTILKCTPEHNVYLESGKKIRVKDLKPRDKIQNAYRCKTKAISVEHIREKQDVYNGTVDDTHSYYVHCEKGAILSANCGEAPLLPNEACVLGSINLANMIHNGSINWDKLEYTIRVAVRFLDNAIDVSNYPLEIIKENVLKTRKIGLGIMGFHEMLIRMGIPYDSEQGVFLARRVMKFLQDTAKDESSLLGIERGSFPAHKGSTFNIPMRNAVVTTIAPTGTISLICGTSSGIEPLFSIAMIRNHDIIEGTMVEVNSLFSSIANRLGFHNKDLMQKVAEQGGVQDIKEIPEDIRRVFVTSHDISPEWHVRMQAAIQEYTCNAVSKTVNLKNNATIKDVLDAYILAYELGCKGITVYRDGSRDNQVLNRGTATKIELPKIEPIKDISVGTLYTCPSCGNKFQVYEGTCAFCPSCGQKECS